MQSTVLARAPAEGTGSAAHAESAGGSWRLLQSTVLARAPEGTGSAAHAESSGGSWRLLQSVLEHPKLTLAVPPPPN